jgi:hypothetical protein
MSDPIVTPSDLQTLLGADTVDVDRATLILALAQEKCETVLTPLPATARSVVLGIAVRAISNISSAHSMAIGSANVSYGSANSSFGVGGIYLSRSDITELRRLAGAGGVYTLDPTPADAGTGIHVWSQNVTWLTGIPTVDDFG